MFHNYPGDFTSVASLPTLRSAPAGNLLAWEIRLPRRSRVSTGNAIELDMSLGFNYISAGLPRGKLSPEPALPFRARAVGSPSALSAIDDGIN